MGSVEKWLHSLIAHGQSSRGLKGKVPIYLYSWVERETIQIKCLAELFTQFHRKLFSFSTREMQSFVSSSMLLSLLDYVPSPAQVLLPKTSDPAFEGRKQPVKSRVWGLSATRHIPQKLCKELRILENTIRYFHSREREYCHDLNLEPVDSRFGDSATRLSSLHF